MNDITNWDISFPALTIANKSAVERLLVNWKYSTSMIFKNNITALVMWNNNLKKSLFHLYPRIGKGNKNKP